MQNGEMWKLPKSNSPMWTEQWAYQGTAKSPYIVSAKKKAGWDQTWGCSCGKEMPCKHVIAVQLKEKLAVSKSKIFVVVDNTPAAVVGKKYSSLEERGRKFRVE